MAAKKGEIWLSHVCDARVQPLLRLLQQHAETVEQATLLARAAAPSLRGIQLFLQLSDAGHQAGHLQGKEPTQVKGVTCVRSGGQAGRSA